MQHTALIGLPKAGSLLSSPVRRATGAIKPAYAENSLCFPIGFRASVCLARYRAPPADAHSFAEHAG